MSNNNKRRHYVTEVVEENPRCLLVYPKKTRFTERFTEEISKTHTIYHNTTLGDDYTKYDLVVFLGLVPDLNDFSKNQKIWLVLFNQKELYENTKTRLEKTHLKYKIVNLGKTDRTIKELVAQIIYKSPSYYSFDFAPVVHHQPWVSPYSDPKKSLWLSLRVVVGIVLFLNLLFGVSFVGQLLMMANLLHSGLKDTKTLQYKISLLEQTNKLNIALSNVPKNTLFWLPTTDNLLEFVHTADSTTQLISLSSKLLENLTATTGLITKQNKDGAEVAETKLRIKQLQQQTTLFNNNYYQTISLWEKTPVPFFNTKKQQLLVKAHDFEEYLAIADKLVNKLPELLGAKGEKRYLILFMNNMELRPGGGFIGSLAQARFSEYSLKELHVYDVYTLDGQLRAHIDPPEAIAKYLHQPHWFLRDSNFSADFSVNAREALKFIKLEADWQDFDGVLGITMSAVQKTLALFPDFYLPDYHEKITSDNFFIKAQSYSEGQFFPGSHQKKNFLEEVFNTLLLKLQQGNYDRWQMAQLVREVFEEKQMVVYFQNPTLQETFDELFWTGRVVSADCNFQQGCFSDFVYVVDANLGVNKANFYIQRTMRLNTSVSAKLKVSDALSLDYYNESSPNVFPGGAYNNYIQIYLPKNTVINSVLVSGQPAVNYDVATELGLRKLGLLVNVPEGGKTNVVVKYDFLDPLKNNQQYQLIVQKQIGSINNDLIWQMELPPTLSLLQSNFTPIVSSTGFVYNTFLQKDRILIVDFK